MTETNSNATPTCAYDPAHPVKTQEVFQKFLLVAEVNSLTSTSILGYFHFCHTLYPNLHIRTTPQNPEIVVSIWDEILVTKLMLESRLCICGSSDSEHPPTLRIFVGCYILHEFPALGLRLIGSCFMVSRSYGTICMMALVWSSAASHSPCFSHEVFALWHDCHMIRIWWALHGMVFKGL